MITVTGRTWEYRDRLKSMGGRWNADTKNWQFSSIAPSDLNELKQLPGITVNVKQLFGITVNEPQRSKPISDDTSLHDFLKQLRDLSKSDDEPKDDTNKTHVFGDDRTWLNYFAGKNPISFWGFSSLGAMIKHIQKLNPDDRRSGARWRGWQFGESKWFGTQDMPAALKLARHGWPEGLEMASEIARDLAGQHAIERRRQYSVAGGSVNVGRMLAGNPLHMINRTKKPGKKIITFFADTFMSAGISIENAIIRAAMIAAIVDVLEMNGFSCEIVAAGSARGYQSEPLYQMAITLKQAGETLNLNDIVFALGHPSFFRRMCFALVSQDEDLSDYWLSMGLPGTLTSKEYPLKSNELLVNKITISQQHAIDDDADLLTKAKQIWDLVASGNLPITLKGEQ